MTGTGQKVKEFTITSEQKLGGKLLTRLEYRRDFSDQPFFTSKRNGTGLGLALVQKIIVFHNGRIGIGTSPQGGASLQITLPMP